uniref:Putative reverse transcriptase domain-containing protein n=1 Tax=Tanacetum cinerariifolium TaxID=118510 RepID=A0A699JXH7_TANCI|nr:putative reverse transcriptase domain-containing protein [Tanacetum cinerariifolium]
MRRIFQRPRFGQVYSKFKDELEDHLRLVLKLMKEEELYAKFSKFLSLPDGVEDFVVYCDASNQELGCVLMQRGKIRYHPGKVNVVADALSRKEQVKPRRARAMAMTIQSGIRGKIKAAQTVQKALGMRLDLSTAYHPQMDGQSKHTIQTLEDMLRSCVIDFGGSWEVHLPLAEFSYNNSYHSSIRCASFEALYGRKYRSPVLWVEIGESSLIGPKLIQETTDKVVLIKEKLKAARDRQKSYADNRRKSLEFEVGDRVMLKVSPWKGVIRFGRKGKLAPRYVGPFEILERIGPVAYRLRLPKELSEVRDTFHVSNLKKCLAYTSLHVPLDKIKIDKTLRFVEEPVEIIDHEVRRLKRSRILLVKVRWNSKCGPEFTWEREDFMKSKYPQLFFDRADKLASLNLETRFPKGGDTVTTMT